MTREKGEGVPCQPATLSQGRKRLVDGKVWMCRYASLIWAQIWVSSDCRTPWLDSHPGPRFQYHGGQNTFVA